MYKSAHNYFKSALQYIQKKFPLDDEVINNAVWIHAEKRAKATCGQVQFFLDKYSDFESILSVLMLMNYIMNFVTINYYVLTASHKKCGITQKLVIERIVTRMKYFIIEWMYRMVFPVF